MVEISGLRSGVWVVGRTVGPYIGSAIPQLPSPESYSFAFLSPWNLPSSSKGHIFQSAPFLLSYGARTLEQKTTSFVSEATIVACCGEDDRLAFCIWILNCISWLLFIWNSVTYNDNVPLNKHDTACSFYNWLKHVNKLSWWSSLKYCSSCSSTMYHCAFYQSRSRRS